MLNFNDVTNVRQAFGLCTAFSAIALAAAALRIHRLPKARAYSPIVGLLACWAILDLLVLGVRFGSDAHVWTYRVLAPVTWTLNVFVARDLYQNVFRRYPGIAFAGRWCVYFAVSCSVAGLAASLLAEGDFSDPLLYWILALDRNIVLGISLSLLLLIVILSRYPVETERNILLHSFFFASILLVQAVSQSADQWTGSRNSVAWNTAAAGFTALASFYWALSLSDAGDTAIMRVRHRLRPDAERHLVGQLNAINGLFLKAVRK